MYHNYSFVGQLTRVFCLLSILGFPLTALSASGLQNAGFEDGTAPWTLVASDYAGVVCEG